jgi:iron(III) transport system ATP-binding protein
VYVTHDQIEAMTLSDKIVVMNQCIIEQIGTPLEVYRFPNSRFVADFIGRANFVDGRVLGQESQTLTVEALGEAITLLNVKGEFRRDEPVTLIVRPEMIQIKKDGGHYQGTVRRAVYLGDVMEYTVDVNGLYLLGVETDPTITQLFPEGENVTLQFAEGCIQVLPSSQNGS